MVSGLSDLDVHRCLTGLDTGAIFLLEDTGSQADERTKMHHCWVDGGKPAIRLIFNFFKVGYRLCLRF